MSLRTEMKKIMIVGAGVEQIPAIEIAKSMGHYVIVTDMSESAPGNKIADKNYIVSTNDPDGNLEVAKKEAVDGIMTLCSETAVPVIAYVSSKLGIPGMTENTSLAATNKGVMREILTKHNVPLSGYIFAEKFNDIQNFAKNYRPPWVVKPSDSSGQRGIRLIYDEKELKSAWEEAKEFSTDNRVIIEEFVSGPEINITCLTIDGKVHVLSLSDRETLPSPHFGIANMHLAPPNLTKKDIVALNKIAIDSTKAIGLKNGISYPQVILTSDGPKLLEIAARIPGGNMREVAMYISGIDMIRTSIQQALGEKLLFKQLITEKPYSALAVKFITSLDINIGNKSITSISGVEEAASISGVKFCYLRLQKGQKIPELSNSGGRFGAILAVGDTREEAMEKTKNAFKKIIVT